MSQATMNTHGVRATLNPVTSPPSGARPGVSPSSARAGNGPRSGVGRPAAISTSAN
jgi:hypothetical protein